MIIAMVKFGSVLSSRQAGKEAFSAFSPTLAALDAKEEILVDFDGVISFSPSWGDEFLTPLQTKFTDHLTLKNIKNPSVSLTLAMLEKINGSKFKSTPPSPPKSLS